MPKSKNRKRAAQNVEDEAPSVESRVDLLTNASSPRDTNTKLTDGDHDQVAKSLVQSIQRSDVEMLNNILDGQTDQMVINKTVQSLPIESITPMLLAIQTCIQTGDDDDLFIIIFKINFDCRTKHQQRSRCVVEVIVIHSLSLPRVST